VPNALAQETSPYLRQHAGNPVDWLPWGTEAFALALERNVPVLVSIGYSACHWCHVMERESFEDAATAALMNSEFVCVKVDREERPDVDAIYMEAVQGMTGHGGWPLNVFLTPEQLPFYGGTYFPPEPRHGMPAWTQVLQAIAESWRTQAAEVRAGGERIRERLGGGALLNPSDAPFDGGALDSAVQRLRESFDTRHGGFGGAPKFPQAPVIEFLLVRATAKLSAGNAPHPELSSHPESSPNPEPSPNREPSPHPESSRDGHGKSIEAHMALDTLRAMAGGGIYDQVGGGFHRYSVDTTWTVPHFEKMLYDNALLARAYLHGFVLSGDGRLAEVCRETLDWMEREMGAPEGGFYSALDADSEGVEGRFYVWTVGELRDVLGEDGDVAVAWLGASAEGNFEDPHDPQPGLNVLTDRHPAGGDARPEQATRERIRERLLATRATRTRPGLDDKRLTSWNALAIAVLAEAGAVLREPRYLNAAVRCAEFVLGELRDDEGRLLRTYNDGEARIGAYLEDHAFLLEGMLALFEASCEERWLSEARALADQMIARFADPERGGFFSTPSDHETLIVRRKDLEDSPIPSGTSSAALGLLRLAQLTGEADYERQALGALALVHEIAARHPSAFGHMLQALHCHLSPARGIACAIPPATAPTGSGPAPTA
jgi:uncharacterized protein